MRTLHSIISQGTRALVWASVYGVRNVPLGDGVAHLYKIQRNTINPMGSQSRVWFEPWMQLNTYDRSFVLNPLCGPIRTRSYQPRLQFADDRWAPRTCRVCADIAEQQGQPTNFWRDLHRSDPWHNVPSSVRLTTPDPVTGL